MPQTLEQRIEELERKVAELTKAASKKDPFKSFGIFKDDKDYQEAMRLGREYREQQTYEKEIAGS